MFIHSSASTFMAPYLHQFSPVEPKMHFFDPIVPENNPGGHAEHCVLEKRKLCRPGGHKLQNIAPRRFWYEPGGHW